MIRSCVLGAERDLGVGLAEPVREPRPDRVGLRERQLPLVVDRASGVIERLDLALSATSGHA